MRTRVLVVLLALVAMAVVPAESLMAESAGSVVGQVASCIEPSGLVRGAEDGVSGASCGDHLRAGTAPSVLAVTFLVGAALAVAASRSGRRRRPPAPQRSRAR